MELFEVKDVEQIVEELDPRTHEATREHFDGIDPEKAAAIATYRAEANRLAVAWALKLREALHLYQTKTNGNGDSVEDAMEDVLMRMVTASLPGGAEVEVIYKEYVENEMDGIEGKTYSTTADVARRILALG